jgi:sugar phosphate isomerase/epimerase
MALKIGLQMYSVRKSFEKDPLGTIAKVADIGYKYLELANRNAYEDPGSGIGVTAKDLKESAQRYGGDIFSAHIHPFDKKNVDRVIEYHAELGTKFLISKGHVNTRDNTESLNRKEAEELIDLYCLLGEKCRAAGMQHALHTSIASYDEFNDWSLDTFYKETSKENLMFELDTYWLLRSGYDPVQIIRKFADRLVIVHQKDLPKKIKGRININENIPRGVPYGGYGTKEYFESVTQDDFVEIGEGQMDLQGIVDATIKYTSATHIVLEQDFTKLDEIESIKISMENFKKIRNIEF